MCSLRLDRRLSVSTLAGLHRCRRSILVLSAALCLAAPGSAVQPSAAPVTSGEITFAQRVEAQRAIERVYYIHRSGSEKGFAEAVPESFLEEKVRTYLAESVALETLWDTPVTAKMLQREVERMAGATRLPDRLRDLRAALGNDERLFAETLARATLVDRLCRSFLASDSRLQGTDW